MQIEDIQAVKTDDAGGAGGHGRGAPGDDHASGKSTVQPVAKARGRYLESGRRADRGDIHISMITVANERTASAVLLKFLVSVGGNIQDEILDLTVQYPAQIIQRFRGYVSVMF